jgi:hypothetical protein
MLCERLAFFWNEPNERVQEQVCQLLSSPLVIDYVINQMPLLLWLKEMITKCFVVSHLLVLARLDKAFAMVGPIEPLWTLLHAFRFPFDSGIAHQSICFCFYALYNIVSSQPQLAQHCVLTDIIQGLHMMDPDTVRNCAGILGVMALNRVADCSTIFQWSLSALHNRPKPKSHPSIAAIMYGLWKVLTNSSDDQNGFAEWAIEIIEKEVGHGEFSELQMIFQSFSQEDSPREPEDPTVRCLTRIIEHLQSRE